MFSPTKHSTEDTRLEAQVRTLNESADTWYTGSIDSVDHRIRQARAVHKLSARGDTAYHLEVTGELERELEQLRLLRADLIGASLTEIPPDDCGLYRSAVLTPWGREFVATHLNRFLADNTDALTNADELAIRATHYAEKYVSTLPVSEASPIVARFRTMATSRAHAPSVPKEASLRSEFDDELLFD